MRRASQREQTARLAEAGAAGSVAPSSGRRERCAGARPRHTDSGAPNPAGSDAPGSERPGFWRRLFGGRSAEPDGDVAPDGEDR
ncbi:hypothetical protein NKG05_01890 [Oerskovia sp. M15]